MTISLSEVLSPGLHEVHRAVRRGGVDEVVLAGGRGSTKSSFASVELVKLLLEHPECHAVVLRKVANTLRTSVYEQVAWAIGALGLAGHFELTVSPMRAVYRPTGQRILFLGLDDPGKLKSIKVPFGYIGLAWFEELDQFSGPEEIRNVEQSLFRGGSFSFAFKSFNPPAMARSWANRYALEARAGKLVHHSDYRNVPPAWLGTRFLQDAEHLADTNPTAYRHEYLGEVVGSGNAVFENLRMEAITAEQLAGFDRIYNGLDWGFYPDPWAFNQMHYDAARRTLYIFGELTRYRAGNQATAAALRDYGITGGQRITADSAEPKSVADYKDYGFNCRGAIKGAGSVEYSMKWLQALTAIVIDPERCPDTAKEFGEYEYERTSDGSVRDGYPDADNHHIDAVRYGMEPVWRRKGA